ncbi:MAG: nucleotidyl transferase AbiEii/AbiGii toxin family protein [Oligoflexia bacterium]|nr:nucleotidyl transferase AbiEii/AbiGii toxin family protein [Oligoflexia bacterium]
MYNQLTELMLKQYSMKSLRDYENALKEIIQQVTLLGLWRAKFFEHALFYGGSALRILYGLDRFSEDLDFSLIKKNPKFTLSKYKQAIIHELESFGFQVEFQTQEKKIKTPIDSAFLKANTLIHLLKIDAKLKTHSNASLQVKLEVDREPALGFIIENKTLISPVTFSVQTMNLPSLFSGKMHAILCRKRVRNIKGRDWYDTIWYAKQNIPMNRSYLKNKLKETSPELIKQNLSDETFQQLYLERVKSVDFEMAKKDIIPFLKTKEQLREIDFWSEKFFIDTILPKLKFKD